MTNTIEDKKKKKIKQTPTTIINGKTSIVHTFQWWRIIIKICVPWICMATIVYRARARSANSHPYQPCSKNAKLPYHNFTIILFYLIFIVIIVFVSLRSSPAHPLLYLILYWFHYYYLLLEREENEEEEEKEEKIIQVFHHLDKVSLIVF